MDRPRILFAGTPTFAVPALSALIAADWPVVAVYTQPDRPAGRGRKITPGPVKQTALDADIPVFQPTTLKRPEALEQLETLAPDLMVVAAYGLILPPAVLDCPRLGCINIHASLLPRWRGAAPIQRAIAAGDEQTGISLMQMEIGLDTGPVYATQRTRIGPRETGGSLHDRLAAIGAKLLLDSLPAICEGVLTPEPQDPERATYASKLEKQESTIDWQRSAIEIDRQIRAFDPWPVAQTRYNDETLRIWEACPLDDASGNHADEARPGTVLSSSAEGIDVATGDGKLRIQRLQAPGKRPISAADFAHARQVDGTVFV
ncbi:methionyl-tRNA formyltransferase [Lamprobacter modestohalophilus]|uniref:Methionyl-tRNA formyltransferase n=1 Tax=Lamprobacter modestohalophilus TaxID=1064514 RepID=A0A9X0W9N4_9GAMM|nr:methionyl-tRNA formyltransferase [Lamprobacter modestohalophilus]MBK1619402.1 methionyl-tRNA formyltransferase [Lamprobacter modestohalophilus]